MGFVYEERKKLLSLSEFSPRETFDREKVYCQKVTFHYYIGVAETTSVLMGTSYLTFVCVCRL